MPKLAGALVVAVSLFGSHILGQERSAVTFYGAPWTSSDSGVFYHAFLCLTLRLTNSIKEDCYGFYPRDAGKAAIGGPGKIGTSDIRRISDMTQATAPINISNEQRIDILKRMDDFSKKSYQLNVSNCIDFVRSIVQFLKLKSPDRSLFQTPTEYIRELKKLNGL